jgi:DNA-binding transcriptional MerR regulator
MKNGEARLWTIEELCERVAAVLATGYGGVPNGRVRDVPDLRTIRYYTTLGLLDRPAEMRGRTALYGQRHLLQLVAIKRLQARGLSLAAVQLRVVGLSNAALRRLAEAASPREKQSSRAESFWRTRLVEEQEQERVEAAPPQAEEEGSGIRKAVPLGDGLVLSLVTGRALDVEDLRVIRMAAAPLIELLRLRGLIGPAISK